MTAPERSASFRRRRAGWACLVTVALLAAATVPVSATTGDGGGFSDVGEGLHTPAIEALAEMGVFTGTECEEGFCPRDPVERWVMAVWLIRVLGSEVEATGTSRFADVDAALWWSPYAEELADREITKGCETDPLLLYCPEVTVTRAQMASFLERAFDLEPAEPAGFGDVTEGSTHAADIDALAAAGITKGCETDPLLYCPSKPVTREEMATFLHRALRHQEEAAGSGPVEISDDVPDVDLTDMSTGDTVNLRSVFTGDKAVMFWFWAEW
ncbi:S-layer homology domain-containing protein [Candidatus Spongiisocius sp.]|uniref:S-layer homology domain-containing protein n=1 Tax=Candidatus Spongiisocius sp. TaxID=3101273 RepID=UPI003B5B29C9